MANLIRNEQSRARYLTSQIQVINQRPHDRLGPPVPHTFNRRQRSRDGYRQQIQGPPGQEDFIKKNTKKIKKIYFTLTHFLNCLR